MCRPPSRFRQRRASSTRPGNEDKSGWTPTLSLAFPEFWFTGFKVESAARDTFPDSRFALVNGTPHGRFTHNGDFRTPLLMQTETEWNRDGAHQRGGGNGGRGCDRPARAGVRAPHRVQDDAAPISVHGSQRFRPYFPLQRRWQNSQFRSAHARFLSGARPKRAPTHARRARQSSGGLGRDKMV